MFKIGEFSKLTNVSVRMLRHYDHLGILIPKNVAPDTGYRYYNASQFQEVNRIQKLKEIGFSLAHIKEMLALGADMTQLQNYFAQREQALKQEQEKLVTQRVLLESAVNILKEDFIKMNYHVILKELPQRNVASIRQIIPDFMSEGILWQKLCAEIARQSVKMDQTPCACAIFHDAEYKEADVDVETQMSVIGTYQDTEEVSFKLAPKQQVASVTMNGAYEQMGKVTETAARWIEDHHLILDGSMFNIYHVSPAEDPNPENWVTEVCFPVKNK